MKMLAIISTLAFLIGQNINAQKFDKEKTRLEMKALIDSYGRAVEQMDVTKTIEHFSNDPEFLVIADGKSYDIEQMKTMVRENFYTGLKKVELQWDAIDIKVLSETQAVAYARITQTLTDTNSKVIKVAAEASFIGSKKSGKWKIVYSHAIHQAL